MKLGPRANSCLSAEADQKSVLKLFENRMTRGKRVCEGLRPVEGIRMEAKSISRYISTVFL